MGLSSSSDFPRRFSARAQALALLVTAAPSILAFACLLASDAANLRAEQKKPVPA
jgi:hypothetical protein